MQAAVDAGADVTATDEGGINALGIAAKHGNLGMAEFLARLGVSVTSDTLTIAQMTQFDTTPQMLVMLEGWRIRQMAPDAKGLSEAEKALFTAAIKNDVAAIEGAIQAGATVDVLDKNDTTPLRYAIRRMHTEAFEALAKAGAEPNHESTYGWTPLMEAAACGEEAMIDVLLKAGADPSYKNKQEQTPAWAAQLAGYGTIAKRLTSL